MGSPRWYRTWVSVTAFSAAVDIAVVGEIRSELDGDVMLVIVETGTSIIKSVVVVNCDV